MRRERTNAIGVSGLALDRRVVVLSNASTLTEKIHQGERDCGLVRCRVEAWYLLLSVRGDEKVGGLGLIRVDLQERVTRYQGEIVYPRNRLSRQDGILTRKPNTPKNTLAAIEYHAGLRQIPWGSQFFGSLFSGTSLTLMRRKPSASIEACIPAKMRRVFFGPILVMRARMMRVAMAPPMPLPEMAIPLAKPRRLTNGSSPVSHAPNSIISSRSFYRVK